MMRTVDPALNDGWYGEEYLRAFNFFHLGVNVRIHKTVVLPSPSTTSIGNNVVIGPCAVLIAKNIEIGDNVEIKACCLIDGENVKIPAGKVVKCNNKVIMFSAENEE